MRILLLPMLLAVGLPTCSSFWGGNGGRPQQASQSADAVPGAAKSGGLFGFLPGGCPPVTEQTRVQASNWIYTALRQEGFGLTPGDNPSMALTSLSVVPSKTIPCGVEAHWTAAYKFYNISRTIPGTANLPRSGADIDPSAIIPLKAWAKMIGSNYWQPDMVDRSRAEVLSHQPR